jgi:hypothetical protein
MLQSSSDTLLRRSPIFLTLLALLVGGQMLLWSSTADATPAFARRYETSCQTCHVAFPKLNPFGEAFRMLGYQLPDETEEQIKQPDVKLGAEAYKRVWPDAVWPGAIPQQSPISVVTEFLWENSQKLEEMDGEVETERVTNDFLFPSDFALVLAGNAGERVAYFGEVAVEREIEDGVTESKIAVEHFDFRLIRPIKNSPAFNLKVGAFQPEVVNNFDHARRLTVRNYDSMFGVNTAAVGGAESVGAGHHGGGGGISLPAVSTGLEGFGVMRNRLTWAASVVNGMGPGLETADGNSSKDLSGRLAYKFGGLAPDGSNAATYTSNPKNWQEKSVRVGVLGYAGDGSGMVLEVMDEGVSAEIEVPDFDRYGVDMNIIYGDLNLFGAFIKGSDDIQVVGDPDESGSFDYTAMFAEADVVMHYPWLHGALRYETVDLPREDVDTWQMGTISVTALVRANLKTVVEYTRDLNESKVYTLWLGSTLAF